MKAILNAETVNTYIDLHKDLNIPFEITISNYTTRIKSVLHDLHFMKTEQSNRVFAAFSMVKSQVTKFPVQKINTDNLQYYSHAFKDEPFYSDLIFNCDLKSAYASILFNDGMIDRKTFKYLSSLPKMGRLAAVGMLAGKKEIFQINEQGETVSREEIISPTSDYFFYCVKRTAEIMNEATQHLGQSFLFTWVDGVYFLENPAAAVNTGKIITDFFISKGLKSSFETLTQFNVEVKKDYFYCSYRKEGKLKTMNIPKTDNIAVKKITNHLLNKPY